MGNTCSHVTNNGNRGHHPIEPKVYMPQNQAIHARQPSGNRSGNSASTAIPDVKYVPAPQGVLTTLDEIQKAHTKQKEVEPLIITASTTVPVTIVVTANNPKVNTEEKELAPVTVAAANIQKADIEEQEPTQATTADFNRGNTEEQEVAPATTLAAENEVDGNNIIRSNEDSTSPNSNFVPDDACKESQRSNLPFLIEEDDECPTCLDGYNEENPKIMTKCKHHYHLSCIYEWMERSATCPICSQVLEFDEDC